MSTKPSPIGQYIGNTISPYANPYRRRVGIEIEGEFAYGTCDALPKLESWRTDSDGSLRQGIEFISRILSYGAATNSAIDEFYEVIDDMALKGSVRTGTHVHVDCRDLTIPKIYDVVVSYILCEPLLLDYSGAMRKECIYCIPWFQAPLNVKSLIRVNNKEDFNTFNISGMEQMFSMIRDMNKYSAFFLGPLSGYGTVEFRSAPTWTKPEPLRAWVDACRTVVGLGCEYTGLELCDLFDSMGSEKFYAEYIPSLKASEDIDKVVDTTDVLHLAERLAESGKTNTDADTEVLDWSVNDMDCGPIQHVAPPKPPERKKAYSKDLKSKKIAFELFSDTEGTINSYFDTHTSNTY